LSEVNICHRPSNCPATAATTLTLHQGGFFGVPCRNSIYAKAEMRECENTGNLFFV
jgi:predicted RNase H-like nuclease